MATPKSKEQFVGISKVPVELLERARQIAREQDRSLSSVVRMLLKQYVQENDKQKPPRKK